jgi:hypothetical protein
VGCTAKPTDGAHVAVEGLEGEWILPMCHRHNLTPGAILIRNWIKPVRANIALTCRQ